MFFCVCVCVCVCAGYCSDKSAETSQASIWVEAQRAERSMAQAQGSRKDAYYQHVEQVLRSFNAYSRYKDVQCMVGATYTLKQLYDHIL